MKKILTSLMLVTASFMLLITITDVHANEPSAISEYQDLFYETTSKSVSITISEVTSPSNIQYIGVDNMFDYLSETVGDMTTSFIAKITINNETYSIPNE